jgi:DNA-binding transcriptional LysR family regulator
MLTMDDIELSLLRCFATLYREQHLSRAAQRIGLSQPAMSRSLGRLRDAFGDPLFVRTRHGMLPTPRADTLAPSVNELLAAAAALVRPTAFDPARLERTFVLGTSDYSDADLMPALVDILAREAPGVAVTTRPLGDHIGDTLATGRLDVMITVREVVPADATVVGLYDEGFVCAVRKGHPRVGKRLTLERFCELSHLLIAPSGNPGSRVDNALAARGLTRHVAVRTHTFLSAPAIIAASDLVLTAPTRLFEPLAKAYGLRLLPTPLELGHFSIVAAWHPRLHEDRAHAWFRSKIVEASKRRSVRARR